ncbi:LSU ribosomal protein L6p (L9e) [hydrothermal vent metagenome]|uniref:LSU ribosomal protein L6p (L9e) n=1 Tax=hydrothermal vent metagenome TaxID=652676 RepID=A0A3B0TWT9_9ZZZZ
MSRTGKQPVSIEGVTVSVDGSKVSAKGTKGELSMNLLELVNIEQGEGELVLTPANDSKKARVNWGTSRALVQNIVTGVKDGFSKKLLISGVGYRAAAQGSNLKLTLGFSHDVNYQVPDGIQVQTPQPTEIIVSGIDKQLVGQVAANIREYRKPEPYKGKGVRYEDEFVFRKEGKKK